MKITQLIITVLFSAFFLNANISRAEDIDIYSGSAVAAGAPNVLIILDNTANWNSAFTAEKAALVSTVSGLSTSVNLGLMMLVETGGGNDSVDGSYVRFGVRSMTSANRTAMSSLVNGLDILTDKSNNAVYGLSMNEAYLYFGGRTALSGNKVKRDYAGNTVNNPLAASLPGNAFSSSTSTTYFSPMSNECQKNFIIFISNGPAADNSSATTTATTLLAAAGGSTTAITLSPNGSQTNVADEWARFLSSNDNHATLTGTQTIRTYTVDVNPGTTGQGPGHTALLKSMAAHGKGKYFAVTGDTNAISQALIKILNEVQAVNSVFSSSSLPVSVNAQGTFLNQIYMGMFRPDEAGSPRWLGNLKQYKFAYDSSSKTLKLADSLGQGAISAGGTGFLSPDAVSFWTTKNTSSEPDSGGGFWRNQPQSAGGGYDSADGELVEKGGAAQVLRLANLNNTYTALPGTTSNPRKLYTYISNAQLSATSNAFDSSNASLTDALLGTGSRTVNIVSASTVQATGAVPTASGSAAFISITAFSKTGSTVTATVSAGDWALLSVGSQIKVATGTTKYDCNVCTVTTKPTATTFTYTGGAGPSAVPGTPYTATIYTNFVLLTYAAHGLSIGQNVTLSSCTTYTALNGTIVPITAITTNTFTVATVSVSGSTSDAGCRYTRNLATATSTVAHGFPNGDTITISGASPTGYNGAWVISVTGTYTFTYEYTVAAPLAASSATATGNTTRVNLTKWVRGNDYKDEESGPGSAVSNVRPSLHGDVLHSRPTVVNYGGSTGVVVFYGGNDGVYRAVNGNQTGTGAGSELWGFIPTEFFGKLKRLHDNSPVLKFPSTSASIIPAPARKDYFADGSTGTYQKLNADGTTNTAYLYIAMRRGGRLLYALDVSTPSNPGYLWKITNTGDFTELGETWSQPKVAQVQGYANPVLIFGAGYDTAEDTEPPTANTMGRGIFIVDAITGAQVWKATYGGSSTCSGTSTKAACTVAGMNYSIPSDITMIDHNGDGKIDRLYATDTGGNVWRVDLEPSLGNTPDYWKVNKLAALGCGTGSCSSGTAGRKFYYPADVVFATGYDEVLVGSGDREHPLLTDASYSITNRFYMLKDLAGNDGSTTAITEANLFDATSTVYNKSLSGFYVTLDTGEKVVNAPYTVAGYTYFGTNRPMASASACSANLGVAKGYSLDPFTGVGTSVVYDGGGMPPSPVAGLVDVDGKLIAFCIGCGGAPSCVGADCSTAIGGGKPVISVSTKRNRTYWYIKGK